MSYINREEWLTAALEEIRPIFDAAGHPLPAHIRVSVGFPLTFKRTRKMGEAYPAASSGDQTVEVLIAPTVDDNWKVFSTLFDTLESISKKGVVAGDVTALANGLGKYPHAAITIKTRKPQKARMFKAECPTCGMIIRLSDKWIKQLPVCSADGDDFVAEEVAA